MRYLLDTHVLLWAIGGSKRLPKEARELLMDPDHTFYYSGVSVWEVVIKHGVHPDEFRITGKEFADYCKEAGYVCMNIAEEHILMSETLKVAKGEKPHADPFDRMLIAQAKAEKIVLLTKDVKMQYYHEPCVRYLNG